MRSGEAGEDEGFLGADIIEHTEDFDLEVLDFVSVKDRSSGTAHPGFEVLERGPLVGIHNSDRLLSKRWMQYA